MTDCPIHSLQGMRDGSIRDPGGTLSWLAELERAELHGAMTRIVRIAMGRIGGRFAPWLDEGLMMGHGLATLLDSSAGEAASLEPADGLNGGERTLRRVVSGIRNWARGSSWFARAVPRRVDPLCASQAAGTAGPDEAIVAELDIEGRELQERFTEAGLVFGVGPELMLPHLSVACAGSAGPEDQQQSTRVMLADTISARPIEQRRVLTLYFQQNLSFPEIAELTDLPPARVQELYGRAAVCIRAELLDRLPMCAGEGG